MKPVDLLLIDNYDSFTYNLYHLLSALKGVNLTLRRNDENYLEELDAGAYDAVIIGPGPGSPLDESYFGDCLKVITAYGTRGLPILGVCLGFQGIAHAFGATLKKASLPMHGKLSELEILKRDTLFTDVPDYPLVMRYHSLLIDPDAPFPSELIVTAEVKANASSVLSNGRELMAIEHRTYPIYGVQFHPESFATEIGVQIVENFLRLSGKYPLEGLTVDQVNSSR